jgi:hypothetical protein
LDSIIIINDYLAVAAAVPVVVYTTDDRPPLPLYRFIQYIAVLLKNSFGFVFYRFCFVASSCGRSVLAGFFGLLHTAHTTRHTPNQQQQQKKAPPTNLPQTDGGP